MCVCDKDIGIEHTAAYMHLNMQRLNSNLNEVCTSVCKLDPAKVMRTCGGREERLGASSALQLEAIGWASAAFYLIRQSLVDPILISCADHHPFLSPFGGPDLDYSFLLLCFISLPA